MPEATIISPQVGLHHFVAVEIDKQNTVLRAMPRAVLCHQYSTRQETTRKRRQALDEEVRRIASDLRARGHNRTHTRIRLLLGPDSLKEWRALRRSVKRARRFLGLN